MNDLSKEEIYNAILYARKLFIEEYSELYIDEDFLWFGMCYFLDTAFFEKHKSFLTRKFSKSIYSYSFLVELIPEFTPQYFNSHGIQTNRNIGIEGNWWNKSDIESRIKAFDLLLDLYKD